jgi:DNA invertase Pin-like site-specific DNA recombinase
MAKLGYARVSAEDQDFGGQVDRLKAAGCDRIYAEKASGQSTNGRPELARLIKALQPGDTVIVIRIDRFARSIRDLLSLVDQVKGAGAGFVSLDETWCDTTSPQGNLLLTIMGGFAEFERALIRQRCDAGIARAKAAGKHKGCWQAYRAPVSAQCEATLARC